jgi:hypothetical protein
MMIWLIIWLSLITLATVITAIYIYANTEAEGTAIGINFLMTVILLAFMWLAFLQKNVLSNGCPKYEKVEIELYKRKS